MGCNNAKLLRPQLHRCATDGLWVEIQHLIKQGHDVNQRYGKDESTALHCAAREGRIDSVRMLVVGGANINCMTKEGRTPLLLAAENGHWNACKYLIEKGAYGVPRRKWTDSAAFCLSERPNWDGGTVDVEKRGH